jgi:FtsH-binding integral membrane protein
MLLQPVIWVLFLKFGQSATTSPLAILGQATVITLAIFVGLTATVFVTKKDFSFLRGALMIGMFAALGVILASWAFGFSLGAVFCGAMILLMAGYILYQTSLVMKEFPPTHHVAAALMLFGTVAMLFWYVLQLLMSLRGND